MTHRNSANPLREEMEAFKDARTLNQKATEAHRRACLALQKQ